MKKVRAGSSIRRTANDRWSLPLPWLTPWLLCSCAMPAARRQLDCGDRHARADEPSVRRLCRTSSRRHFQAAKPPQRVPRTSTKNHEELRRTKLVARLFAASLGGAMEEIGGSEIRQARAGLGTGAPTSASSRPEGLDPSTPTFCLRAIADQLGRNGGTIVQGRGPGCRDRASGAPRSGNLGGQASRRQACCWLRCPVVAARAPSSAPLPAGDTSAGITFTFVDPPDARANPHIDVELRRHRFR